MSSVSNRRDLSAKATRAAVLSAARTAFGEHGFAGASLHDIARAARATTGALYHHFSDKKTLFAAVAEEIEAELVARLLASLPESSDPWDFVRYAVDETLEYCALPGIARVIFKDAPTVLGADVWRAIEMKYSFGQLSALLTGLAKSGQLGELDPALVAGIILGALVQTADAVVNAADMPATLRSGRLAMHALLDGFRVKR